MQNKSENNQTRYRRIRRSRVILIGKIIVAQIVILAFLMVARTLMTIIGINPRPSLTEFISVKLIVVGTIQILDLYLVLSVILKWASEYYVLVDNTVYIHRGIFKKHQIAYSIERAESVSVQQSIFGTMFDYGTVVIFSPTLYKTLFLTNIDKPKHFANIIQSTFKIQSDLIMKQSV